MDVADIIEMKNDSLKKELYLCKGKNSGDKAALIEQLTIAIVQKR